MAQDSVRKSITNAHFNERQSGILIFEIFLIATGAGLKWQSWWIFGGVLLGMIMALFIPVVSLFLMFVLSVIWAAIGAGIGSLFDSTAAMVVLGILGFLMGLGVHMAALEWAHDVGH